MVEDRSPAALASDEVRRIIPGADDIRVQVLSQIADRVIAVAEPVVDGRLLAPIQVLLLPIGDEWVVWKTGTYEEWLEVEGGTGVVVKSFRVDPEASSVRFSDQQSPLLDIGTERRAHAVLWSVSAQGPWSWPAVDEILFADGGRPAVSPRLPVTLPYLIQEYISALIGEGGWAWNALADLIDQYPHLALDALARAADMAHDEEVISRIGAGHLESLVRRHGHALDKGLASAASSSAAVRLALQSVWAPLPPATAAVAEGSSR